MKICSRCKEAKQFEDFGKFTKAKDGRQPMCRVCKAADHQANRPKRVESILASKARRVEANQKWAYEYLLAHPCACGEGNPLFLDFDHVDPSKKKYNISAMITGGYSQETIQTEIDKCVVRCVYCHRLRTAEQFAWWKFTANAYVKAEPIIIN